MSYRERFLELLDDDASFYNFKKRFLVRYWGQGYYAKALFDDDNPDTIDNMGPGEIICKLSEGDYEFTQDEFDKFIKCATYAGPNSWLIGGGIHCLNNEKDEEWENEEFCYRKMVMEIMFKQFKPDADQLDKMIECHKYDPFTWISVLKEKGYELSWSNKDCLSKYGYCDKDSRSYDDEDSIASTK